MTTDGVLVPTPRAALTVRRLLSVVDRFDLLAVVPRVGHLPWVSWLIALVACRTLSGRPRSAPTPALLLVALDVTVLGRAFPIVALRQGMPVDLAVSIRSTAAVRARRLVAMLGGAPPVAPARIRVHIGTGMVAGLRMLGGLGVMVCSRLVMKGGALVARHLSAPIRVPRRSG